MRLKVNILLILFCCSINYISTAQSTHFFKYLKVSDTNTFNPNTNAVFEEMEFAFFDTSKNKIYLSFELHSIETNDSIEFISIEIKKKSPQQNRLKPIIQKRIPITQNINKIFMDSLDISENLASGNYDLIVALVDNKQLKKDFIKHTLQTIRKNNVIIKNEFEELKLDVNQDIAKTFVNKYSDEQLLKNIKSLMPIGELGELKAIETFSLGDKNARLFFYNFWYNRNSSDPEKEWKTYAEKLNYVSKKYGKGGVPGYESDRGKIYLIFGEPFTLERRDNEKDALPYEVWFYYETKGRKNVKFLFYQPGNLSEQMIILHSTEEDILVNPYWKNVLLKDPTNGDNKLMYRVFEYFK